MVRSITFIVGGNLGLLTFHIRHCWRLFFRPARRRNKRDVVILLKRVTTPLDGNIVPALRVAPEKASLGVARRSLGIKPNHAPRALMDTFLDATVTKMKDQQALVC